MNIFKTFSLTWWQAVIFKVCLIALGVAIGAYWNNIFIPLVVPLLVVAVVCGIYLTVVWCKQ